MATALSKQRAEIEAAGAKLAVFGACSATAAIAPRPPPPPPLLPLRLRCRCSAPRASAPRPAAGIATPESARKFCAKVPFPSDIFFVDPDRACYRELGLYKGAHPSGRTTSPSRHACRRITCQARGRPHAEFAPPGANPFSALMTTVNAIQQARSRRHACAPAPRQPLRPCGHVAHVARVTLRRNSAPRPPLRRYGACARAAGEGGPEKDEEQVVVALASVCW